MLAGWSGKWTDLGRALDVGRFCSTQAVFTPLFQKPRLRRGFWKSGAKTTFVSQPFLGICADVAHTTGLKDFSAFLVSSGGTRQVNTPQG